MSSLCATATNDESSSSSSDVLPEHYHLIGLGYPLVDIIQRLPDRSVLEKYGLNANDAILAQEQHLALYQDLLETYTAGQKRPTTSSTSPLPVSSPDDTVHITAGGSTLNTVRIATWIIDTIIAQRDASKSNESITYRTGFIGRIGSNDPYSILLEQAMEQDNVVSLCEKTESSASSLPTGTSAVLVYEDQRSLITYLGISRYLTLNYIRSSARIQHALRSSRYVYSCGFMCQYAAPEHYSIALAASELTLAVNHIFAINLSAEYICRDFTEQLLCLIHRSMYVFGNEAEALVLGQTNKWIPEMKNEDKVNEKAEEESKLTEYLESIGQRLAFYRSTSRDESSTLPNPSSVSLPTQRNVIITRGAKPVLLVTKNGKVLHVPYAEKTTATTVTDPTGAGDAFVGGFLATLILNERYRWYDEQTEEDEESLLIKAVEVGHWCARQIIAEIGVRFDRTKHCPLLGKEWPKK